MQCRVTSCQWRRSADHASGRARLLTTSSDSKGGAGPVENLCSAVRADSGSGAGLLFDIAQDNLELDRIRGIVPGQTLPGTSLGRAQFHTRRSAPAPQVRWKRLGRACAGAPAVHNRRRTGRSRQPARCVPDRPIRAAHGNKPGPGSTPYRLCSAWGRPCSARFSILTQHAGQIAHIRLRQLTHDSGLDHHD